MKIQNLLFLTLIFLAFSCQKDDEPMDDGPTVPTYPITFNAVVCDQTIDPTCLDEASKVPAPNVSIFLFESDVLRERGEPRIREDTTDINGQIFFSGLTANDYFYTAVYPNPNAVEEDTKKFFVRISPNTVNNQEEVIFLKK